MGFKIKNKSPVALIPDKISGYRYYDAEAGAYRRVTGKTEGLLEKKAFGIEALVSADVEPVALDVHSGLRVVPLPFTSVEAKAEGMELLGLC